MRIAVGVAAVLVMVAALYGYGVSIACMSGDAFRQALWTSARVTGLVFALSVTTVALCFAAAWGFS